MNDLVVKQNTVGVITLKEITDLINVQHSKAMLKVEQLSKEPSFGEVAKMDTLNLNYFNPFSQMRNENITY